MIDTVKRNTLKRMGLSAAVVAATGWTGTAFATYTVNVEDAGDNALSLANIQVNTRVSALTNDIEVLITNTGDQTTRITQMTPSETSTGRGRFDFNALMANGDLTLAPGQSVTVPMSAHKVVVNGSLPAHPGQQAQSLHAALKRSFSVVTENDAFARVSIVEGIRYG